MTARPLWLVQLLDAEVDAPINNDSRTRRGTFLGWPKERIFSEVLGGGQADFDAPVGHLRGEDRALLYAKYNQPRHLDELGEAFELLFASMERIGQPTLIDLGCGPFTAGLALAAALGPNRIFRYHGIDRSNAMRTIGARLAESARQRGAVHARTTWRFGDDLDQHEFGKIRGDLTLVVASYLLASPTVDVEGLVDAVLRALERIGPGPAAILYTNSAKPGPNVKYPRFRDALLAGGFKVKVDRQERFEETRNPADLRYALLFRPATTTLKL